MSTNTSDGLDLTGVGAAYVRVSGDRQELQRQLDSLSAFEKRHKVKVADRRRYEDHGLPRDLSAKRPDWQRMMRAAESGALKWIAVDQIDRFGFADEWELAEMVLRLRRAGCKLYDTRDEEWTSSGALTIFRTALAGQSSHAEQVNKSHRVLGGMVAKARAGEWMGGPPRLGLDVGCFDRPTGKELWRVVWQGRDKVGTTKRRGKDRPAYLVRRVRVYPNGTTEQLNGEVEKFRQSKETQVMHVVPTRDKAKLDAARAVFQRFATESITFYDIAKWLNGLGIRNSMGNRFQGCEVQRMLRDEVYLGYPCFAKRRAGRFHRHDADGGVVELEGTLRGKDTRADPADVIRCATRLFEPLIDRPTWDKVQKKLRSRETKNHAPRNPSLYLKGLVVCAGCGKPMQSRGDRMEYYCGTWDNHRTHGNLDDCPCERNGVPQTVIEDHLGRYLDEAGKRLDLLTEGLSTASLTDRLAEQEGDAWRGFAEALERLENYLRQYHPAEYDEICEAYATDHEDPEGDPLPPGTNLADLLGEEGRLAFEKHKDDPTTPGGFVDACLSRYRRCFDPKAVDAELARLRADHDARVEGWRDLPTARAKETAKAKLAALESRIGELEKQREDAAGVVESYWKQMLDLQRALADAREALTSEGGTQALRRKAESLRGLLCRIECEFTPLSGTVGRGLPRSKLVGLTFVPVAGDVKRVDVGERIQANP
jgi:DNA invertase Pin-like site-specific DNA recombinase